jgi:hypothetical protein
VDLGRSRDSAARHVDREQADQRPVNEGLRHCARGIGRLRAHHESAIGRNRFAPTGARKWVRIGDQNRHYSLCIENWGNFASLTRVVTRLQATL